MSVVFSIVFYISTMECEHQGHVVGMLFRDQRTVKMCSFWNLYTHVVSVNECHRTVLTKHKALSHSSVPGRTSPHSSCKTRKTRHFWKSLHRLKHALIVGTYLILLSISAVSGAPVRKAMAKELPAPMWIDPCGPNGASASGDSKSSLGPLITAIVRQTSSTFTTSEKLIKEFTDKTFKVDREQLHNSYKNVDYNWLPTKHLPKSLGEKVDQTHLSAQEFDKTLLFVYEGLQKFAVVLEKIVWDENERNGQFKTEFDKISTHLRLLLCEVHTAIVENQLTVVDVTRDDLPSEFKNMDNTRMNTRNWIVYRDYLNMLEYILQVFKHFQANVSP